MHYFTFWTDPLKIGTNLSKGKPEFNLHPCNASQGFCNIGHFKIHFQIESFF